jgi:ADP-dependent NAD(P)H-hydrate dehydratase / NAD(P)H-hydrate epimerase
VGRGNNGGDALVIGRELAGSGWNVEARYAGTPEEMTELARKKREEFSAAAKPGRDADAAGPLVLIDGLLGIGAQGAMRGRIGEMAAEMNALRSAIHATTFAVDIPSGVDGDTGEPYPGAVVADVTLTISAMKAGLVADRAIDHAGRLALIPLPEIAAQIQVGDESVFVPDTGWLKSRLPRRLYSCHKGQAGRVAIVAGSRGLTGAAKLCGLGALRGGAGLVTVFAHESIYPIIAASAPAEVMVRPMTGYAEARDFPADVLAVGPGLGSDPADAEGLAALMRDDPRPVVIDADALNLLSRVGRSIDQFQPLGPRLLTPHPGEMARLLGGEVDSGRERREIAREFVGHCPVTLLFKGARTAVAERGHPVALNPTGHPGMATGGIGDVLTGLCAALIAQAVAPYDAAVLGSWLIGRSAEMAISAGRVSAESLTASDVADGLGKAFESIRWGER